MLCENCKKFTAIRDIDHTIFLCEVCFDELFVKNGKYWLRLKNDDGFKPIENFPELAGRTFCFNGELLRIRKEDGTEYLVNKDGCSCPARIDRCRHFRYLEFLTKNEPQKEKPRSLKEMFK